MRFITAVFMVFLTSGCAVQQGLPPEQRPTNWAQPLVIEGLPNLHQVSPTLFRAAQPDKTGLAALNAQQLITPNGTPIKTVLSLRAGSGDETILPANGVTYQQIKFNTWHTQDAQVLAFLNIATNPANQPVLLHCKHGADRTGMMTAVYRIVVQNWRKADAIAEMRQGGFGYHPIWSNLIDYINQMDVQAMRAQIKAGNDF